MKRAFFQALALALALAAVPAWGATIQVKAFGDYGWYSDDTRDSAGLDLVGLAFTHYGDPAITPTAEHDAVIAQQIQFVYDAPDGVSALKMDKTSVLSGWSKCTLSTVNEDGFAIGDTWLSGFFADYRYYTNSTGEVTVLKIGIRSDAWALSQVGFTATRSGESAWDLILVDWRGTNPAWTVGAWDMLNTDADTDCWKVYRQGGNAFFNVPPGDVQSLNDWAAETDIACTIGGTPYTWGQILFGAAAKVAGLQFGVGSSTQTSTSYIDWIETSLLNGGERVEFGADLPVVNVSTGLGYTTIQAALDDILTLDGHTITVAAGTFEEQVEVTKSVTIDGAGVGQTIIRSPAALPDYFITGTSTQNHPVVYVHDTGAAALRELTVDGAGRGNANYRFSGVAFWNAGGSLTDCEVLRIMDTPFSGAQHGVAVYSSNNTGGPYAIALTNVVLDDFQKNATALSGTGLTVALDNVTVTGAGPTGVTAQNGIQVGYGASGTLANSSVSGVYWIYPGTGTRWTASGILTFGPGALDITNTVVTECQTGIYYNDMSGDISGCTVAGATTTPDGYDGIDLWTNATLKAGVVAARTPPSPYEETAVQTAGKAIANIAISGTTITGADQGIENWGIWAGGEAAIGLTVAGSTITGWDYGIGAYDDFGGAVTAVAQGNTISGNRAYGVESTTATPVDALNVDWGSPTGPYHATLNPAGLGNAVSDNVLFEPWVGEPQLTIVPAASGPINCGDVPTLAFHYAALAGSAGFKGYTVTVETSAELTFGPADVHFVTPAGVTLGFPQTTEVVAGQKYILDYAIMLPAGFAYVGESDLFTIDFHPTGTGTGTVTLSGVAFRDLNNAPIPVFEPGPATITVDCDVPGGVGEIAVAPGNARVDVSWTASASADIATYEIWRAKWHRTDPMVSAYPEYDDYADNAIPAHVTAYPPGGEWVLAASVPAGTLTYTDVGDTNRGVYYYEVFAIDTAGNPSAPASDYDRATNYWLGDVRSEGSGSYDGLVYVADISKLGSAYGLSVPLDGLNYQVDVGPTDDWSRTGIPLTDSVIDFEDLMVFAMNFDVVTPKAPPAGSSAPVVLAWAPIDDVTWSLRLVEPGAALQGLNIAASLPSGVVARVEPGELLAGLSGPYFLRNIDSHGLDAGLAALGAGASLAGSGELLRVTLTAPADLAAATLAARGTDNSRLEVRLSASTTPGSPLAFRLAQNVPNPFNPMTKIAFALPSAQTVRLEVFAIDGGRVTTLLSEPLGAGAHEVVWDGRDAGGRQVASGTYFFRIDAGPYSETRKMTLMK